MNKLALGLLAAALLFCLSACGEGTATPAVPKPAGVIPEGEDGPPPECDLTIYVDWSLSLHPDALKTAARSIHKDLENVVTTLHVIDLDIESFGGDGWITGKIFTRTFPPYERPDSLDDLGEVGALMGDQIREHRKMEWKRRYAKIVQEELKGLTERMLLPPPAHQEPECSDLNGVLHKGTYSAGGKLRAKIVVTDGGGGDICDSTLHPLADPAGNTALLVVLVPENETSALSYRQFREMQEKIAKAVPWAIVVPFDHKHYVLSLTEAFHRLHGYRAHHASARPATR